MEERLVFQAEQDDARNQQQLVGERVEDPAQIAVLMVMARDEAVHAIADGRHGEGQDGAHAEDLCAVLDVIEHQDNKKRHQQNPEDGNLIGGSHDRRPES